MTLHPGLILDSPVALSELPDLIFWLEGTAAQRRIGTIMFRLFVLKDRRASVPRLQERLLHPLSITKRLETKKFSPRLNSIFVLVGLSTVTRSSQH